MTPRRLVLVLLLACTFAPSVGFAQPTHTAAPLALDRAIDADRLHAHVRWLADDARGGRAANTPGGLATRAYIRAAFEEIGLSTFAGGYVQPFTFQRRGAAAEAANVVGYVRGTASPEAYLVVTAHYDHLGERDGTIYNGADDNASGTAGLIELARYVAAHPLRHSVIFAAVDAEEQGLQGARAFVADPPVPAEAIRLNVNMDMVGRNAAGELYAAGTYHYPALRPPLEEVGARSDVRLLFGHDRPDLPSGDDWTNSSDHGPFHAAGIPFVYFGVEDHPDYHRPTDDVAGIQPDFHAAAVRTVLDALLTLDARPDVIPAD